MMFNIVIDDKNIEVEEGKSLLQACLDNDIYIPNLCYVRDMAHPEASCRLCFVEIEGEKKPVTSCSVTVREGMRVKTDTPSVRRLQRTAFHLLLSRHHIECKVCPANKKCELQKIAKFLKIGLKAKYPLLLPKSVSETGKQETDESHPIFHYYPNRCVLCGKCIHVCRNTHGTALLTFAKRGIDTVISFYGHEDVSRLPGEKCLACVNICPVSAITLKSLS